MIDMGMTIRDIADKANVSVSTISRTINNSGYVSEKTRKKVEAVIRECDYIPNAMAKGLSKNSSSNIGALIPEIDNPFFSGTLRGINQVCDEKGLNLMLCGTEEKKEKEMSYINSLREQRVQGLLVAPATNESSVEPKYLALYKNLNIPVVLFDRVIPGCDYDCVLFDDTQALMELTGILLDNGHRHIEILAGSGHTMTGRNRAMGFMTAFQLRQLEYDGEWVHYCDFTKEEGCALTRAILDRPLDQRPTAIVTGNNMLTLGALRAIAEMGLSVPSDIALVGYDELEILEYLQFNITLAEKDTKQMGRVAMDMLWERMQSNGAELLTRKIVMKPKIVIRGSEKFPSNRSK